MECSVTRTSNSRAITVMPMNMVIDIAAMIGKRGRCVAGLGRPEGGHAVGDGFDAGESRRTRGEGPHDQQDPHGADLGMNVHARPWPRSGRCRRRIWRIRRSSMVMTIEKKR